MTQSKPPALASWMLDHLLWGGRNEALAGDLLEEFQRRRSVAWYWRQVLGAIVASVTGELRRHWKLLSLEAVFVLVWTYYSLLFLRFAQERFWAMAFEPHSWVLWWILLRCSGIVSATLPVIIYLAATRLANFRTVICGLGAGIAVSLTPALLGLGLGFPSGSSWSTRLPVILYGFLPTKAAGILPFGIAHPWWSLPYAVWCQSAPLLFAVWLAHLCGKGAADHNFQTEAG